MRRLLVIVSAGLTALTVIVWSVVFLVTPGRPAAATFEVNVGDSATTVIRELREQGFIRSQTLFKLILVMNGWDQAIQPGQYDLSGVTTCREMAERLTRGGVSAVEFVLLIKEGDDLRDIEIALQAAGYEAADGLLDVTGAPTADYRKAATPLVDAADDYGFLADKPSSVSLEGYLFPDTYRLPREAEPAAIVRRLLDNFGRRLTAAGLLDQIEQSDRSMFEVVTMASLLEKEVRKAEDRRKVADIFWRRLDMGMPLQADSTVNYVTGGNKPAISLKETNIDSRYNTYKYPGLPAGPISNPGLVSIQAAADPIVNDYWYFLTDAEGVVHYAVTLEEHAANKARYLKP